MGSRRRAREAALKILYQVELAGQTTEEAEGLYWAVNKASSDLQEFATRLVGGVLANLQEIDDLLAKYSEHWKLKRMTPIDRNILRLAAFEMKIFSDIPTKVTLNEAIEIAKKYGSEESSAFINGILDKIAKEIRTG